MFESAILTTSAVSSCVGPTYFSLLFGAQGGGHLNIGDRVVLLGGPGDRGVPLVFRAVFAAAFSQLLARGEVFSEMVTE